MLFFLMGTMTILADYPQAVKAVNKIDLPIIVHEDMVKRRGTANSKGEVREYPTFPELKELTPAKIVNTKKPLLIASDLACVTGEIPRTVGFEKGLIKTGFTVMTRGSLTL